MPRASKPPAYCKHKASGQAIVTINGKDIYLGDYGSAESRELYAKLLAEVVKPEELVRRPTVVIAKDTVGITHPSLC
jgi:hypothetical protein